MPRRFMNIEPPILQTLRVITEPLETTEMSYRMLGTQCAIDISLLVDYIAKSQSPNMLHLDAPKKYTMRQQLHDMYPFFTSTAPRCKNCASIVGRYNNLFNINNAYNGTNINRSNVHIFMNQRIAKKLREYLRKKTFTTDDFNDIYRISLQYIIQFTDPNSNVLSVYGQYISNITQLLQSGHDGRNRNIMKEAIEGILDLMKTNTIYYPTHTLM